MKIAWLIGLLVGVLGVAESAWGQLTPERLYYGVDQRVPVRVDAPDGFVGELTIRLHEFATGEVVAEAAASEGRADFASLLPVLWSDEAPRVTLLAQLYGNEAAIGAPMVVQPLLTPNTAMLVDPVSKQPSMDPRAEPAFEDERLPVLKRQGLVESGEREVTHSGLRLYVEREVVIETSAGEMVYRMRPDAAPNTVFNFLHLVEGGFYTDVIVHRVVAALPDGRPFVIQFGDLSGTGSGGPGYATDLERSSLKHAFGVLSMARSADPNTNGSQVFVCLSREGTSFLDARYTSFAEAVSGADVIRAIASVEVDTDDRPVEPPVVTRAYVRDAPAITARPVALWEVEASIEADLGRGDTNPGR